MEFVLATANPDKAAEILSIIGARVNIRTRPSDVPEVEESGATLLENARLKGRALCEATGLPALADDTGLEVDALDGAPGVKSSRYAGPAASYADNVRKLLNDLTGIPEPRTARFRTVALAVWPDGRELVEEGLVEGAIATAAAGTNGFGYDPIFIPLEGNGGTFAEMAAEEKHRLSHRGRAFRRLADRLHPELCT